MSFKGYSFSSSLTILPIRLKKYKERLELTILIKSISLLIPSCSYYKKHSRSCLVLESSSSKCSKCVYYKIKYDHDSPSVADIAAVS